MEIRFQQIMMGAVKNLPRLFGLDLEGRVWVYCPHEHVWEIMSMEAQDLSTPETPESTPLD